MPRVYTLTKSNRGKTYNCAKCGQPIVAGDVYHDWTRRFGRSGITYRQHASCGRPTPTQLSSRKTARIEEARQQVSLDVAALLDPEQAMEADASYDLAGVIEDLVAAMEPVADEAEAVADEYEEGVQNMPEGLQQGPTGEAMQQVADELRDWAEQLRDFQPGTTEVDLPDPDEAEGDEDTWRQLAQDAIDSATSDLQGEAEGLLDEQPEYQG